jgi:hypothetical protein
MTHHKTENWTRGIATRNIDPTYYRKRGIGLIIDYRKI